MAFQDIHVNGTALLMLSKQGTTLQQFGVTDDGMNIRLTYNFDPVMTDDRGAYVPADLQAQGGLASISGRMTRWDDAIMETVRGRIPGRAGGTQVDADIGALVFTGGLYWRLFIQSALLTGMQASAQEKPWYFPCVVPTEEMLLNLGTKHSKAPLGFTAYPLNGVLYTRAAPGS